jgi:hypothetical protein
MRVGWLNFWKTPLSYMEKLGSRLGSVPARTTRPRDPQPPGFSIGICARSNLPFPSFPLLHPISYTRVCNSLPPCLETKTATASVSIFPFLNPVLSALSVFSSVHPFGPSTFLFPSVLSHSLATAATLLLLLLRLLPYTSITSFYLPTYCKESSSIIIATSL